jgi:hypothetical protein
MELQPISKVGAQQGAGYDPENPVGIHDHDGVNSPSITGGPDGAVQFNKKGVLSGSENFTWDDQTKTLTFPNQVTILTEGENGVYIYTDTINEEGSEAGPIQITPGNAEIGGGLLLSAGNSDQSISFANDYAEGGDVEIYGGSVADSGTAGSIYILRQGILELIEIIMVMLMQETYIYLEAAELGQGMAVLFL